MDSTMGTSLVPSSGGGVSRGDVDFEVVKFEHLRGGGDIHEARLLYYAHQSGMYLRQVVITINNSDVFIEAGALQYMHGEIAIDNPLGGLSGFVKKRVNQVLTGETLTMPRYKGTGKIFLEPAFCHFALVDLVDEEIVVDKGLYYASTTGLKVGVATQKNLSSALLGGEGIFQTKVSGSGTCLLALPVPEDELVKVTLAGEKLQVDGNFALLRKGDITFSVEKSSKSITGSLSSGEGWLQTFSGHGEVWLAPTVPIYSALSTGGLAGLRQSGHSRGANIKSKESRSRYGLLRALFGI